MNILGLLPNELKQQLWDNMLGFLARHADRVFGERVGQTINQFSSQVAFSKAFDGAVTKAIERFSREYTPQDEDLVLALLADTTFWQSKTVKEALVALVRRPGAFLIEEHEHVVQHFSDVLPARVNRERVNRAALFFLRCVAEELWTLPGAKEIREIYNLQFQKISAEAARQQVALLEAQLQATTQFSIEVRQAIVQLATLLEQQFLSTPSQQHIAPSSRPYHNLPQPDYMTFIGRQKELEQLRHHLLPHDRAWQMVIAGVGGVGKSSLALNLAHYYCEHYQHLPEKERFEAIIWITAKEDVLTVIGRKPSLLPNLVLRTLEDMYTTIAQTLEREDITRALPQEQTHLVQKALAAQRTLLIIDNLESVTDQRVQTFLYHLPAPTKCIITSREWIDSAVVLRLTGLPFEEAERMIREEAAIRHLAIGEEQLQQLFRRTEGLPLPIKLGIARLASGENFQQVLRWLGDAEGNLPEYCVKGQINKARQLDPNAWNMLLACSLFDQNAGASREALGSITDLSLADRDDGLTLLQRLSLLNQSESERYWMLPMVQVYAGAELVRSEFDTTFIERWLDHLVAFIEQYGVHLEFHCERAHIIGAEYPNLLGAIRWCRKHHQWMKLLQLAEGTWFYPYFSGIFSETREILEAAVQAAQELHDERQEGHFLRRLGLPLWVYMGGYEKNLSTLVGYLDKAEEIATRYHDEIERGLIGNMRWDILCFQGRFEDAKQMAQTILEIGERRDNLELKTKAAYRLAELAANEQQFSLALAWLERGDEWARGLSWSRRLAWNMYLRGTVLIQQGDLSAAEQALKQSLSVANTWGERRLIAYNTHQLALVYANTNRFQQARDLVKEACDLYEKLGLNSDLPKAESLLRKLSLKGG